MTVKELRREVEKEIDKRGIEAEVGLADGENKSVLLVVECFDMTEYNRRKILQIADGFSLKLYYDAETSLYFKIPKYYEQELEEVDNAGLFYDGF